MSDQVDSGRQRGRPSRRRSSAAGSTLRDYGPPPSAAYQQLTTMLDRLVVDWSRERPDLDMRHKEVVYAIYILRSLFQRHADAVLEPFGLNFNSYGVLATLRRLGAPFELAPTELANLLGFTAGGMSNLLARLEEQGLVSRTQDAEDRRCVHVRLTTKGHRIADDAATAITQSEIRHFATMPPAERRQLYKSLRSLIDSFARM